MFANFLYFIIALLIYVTYQPSKEIQFGWSEAFSLFLLKAFLFTFFSRLQFRRIIEKSSSDPPSELDHRFQSALSRLSAAAIAVYALDIYGLNLPSFFFDTPIFSMAPTLLALGFVLLFIGYLSIIWAFAGRVHNRIYGSDADGESYVISNVMFSIPVLFPWLLLSGVSDILFALPFETPKRILSTTGGEIAYFIFFLMGISLVGPVMIQKFWRCSPLAPGFFRQRIEALCERTGLRYADILNWPIFGGKMITAGVMGLVRRFRYILVTPALLHFLDPEEVDAVIAHEIGHVKKKHLLFYLLFFIGYLLLSYATFDLIAYLMVYAQPAYRLLSRAGVNYATVTSILFSLFMIAIFLIYFRYIFGFFMRNFERQADVYVYAVMDNAKPLISTLFKIAQTSGQPLDKPNWHHFSLKGRIDYLKKCETDRRWISIQDRKIRKSMVVYLTGILAVGFVGYHLNYGQAGKRIGTHFLEKVLEEEIQKSPENPKIYAMLGDLYYAADRYEKATQAYEKAISLMSDDPGVLNNLAWLYATCPEKALRNPQRAVLLAQQALSIEPSPHVWDTLAESLFVSGEVDFAVSAGKQALNLTRDNRKYYEDQLNKFIAAKEIKVH